MKIIITGGAGFIGCNAAARYLESGYEVIIVDNLSREGSTKNLTWLQGKGRLEFANLDVRDERGIAKLFLQHRDVDKILHLAAQVAVTTSVTCPRVDFDINATGTLNVLEAVRQARIFAPLIFTSTNKVYGEMTDLAVREIDGRHGYEAIPFGVSESRNLDFHSPYGCSKGAADQYVLDYHRIYGLRTIVFRQSCIYGYRQMGSEDQGWVAWFMIAAHLGLPITIYGDGKQVRDILFIDDVLNAYEAAFSRADEVSGRAFNIGGGPSNTLSLLELVDFVKNHQHHALPLSFRDWRPGDQKVFVSDIRRAQKELGWSPQVSTSRGLSLLYRWVSENQGVFHELESEVESTSRR